jgi:hypothetical protein
MFPTPEPKRPTWQSEFTAALTERVREKRPGRIRLAEDAICDRIDALEASPASIDDLNERWAMSTALAILSTVQIEVTEVCPPSTRGQSKAA